MVAEAIPEQAPPAEAADSQPSPQDSSPAPAELSIEEAKPAEDGSGAPEPRGEVTEPAKPVAQLNPQEQEKELSTLDEKGRSSGLSAEEITRKEQLTQAVNNRKQEYDRFIQSVEADNTARFNEVAGRANAQWSELAGTINSLKEAWTTGEAVDFNTLIQLHDTRLRTFLGTLREAANEDHLRELRKYALETLGDSPENRRALYSYTDPVKLAKDTAEVYRKRLADLNSGDSMVVSKAEMEKAKKDAAKEAVDKFRSENPGYVSPQVAGNGSFATSGKLYSEMTPEEKTNLSSSERDRLVAEEIRVRSSRR